MCLGYCASHPLQILLLVFHIRVKVSILHFVDTCSVPRLVVKCTAAALHRFLNYAGVGCPTEASTASDNASTRQPSKRGSMTRKQRPISADLDQEGGAGSREVAKFRSRRGQPYTKPLKPISGKRCCAHYSSSSMHSIEPYMCSASEERKPTNASCLVPGQFV